MLMRWTGIGLCCLTLTAVLGCESSAPPAAAPGSKSSASKQIPHDHGKAPHGGTIADWGGGKYHLEFTVDHERQQATVYVLGGDARSPEPIAAQTLLLLLDEPSVEITLTAQPFDGERAGTASRFVGEHEVLGKVDDFAGSIVGEIEGIPYSADFDEHAHQH
jgi:hypothetical protein